MQIPIAVGNDRKLITTYLGVIIKQTFSKAQASDVWTFYFCVANADRKFQYMAHFLGCEQCVEAAGLRDHFVPF